jgi:demethylmenaquinone methyltransferase/2-methoxy-6-polyprenyl-1,4-benzoquinol methylase
MTPAAAPPPATPATSPSTPPSTPPSMPLPVAATSPDGGESRVGVGRMFDRIAHRYDALNGLLSFGMHTGWRRRALAWLPTTTPAGAGGGLRILDVATGTADVVQLLLRRHDVAFVTGCDVSEGMLAHGRQKLARDPRGGDAELVTGDATALPFADGSFDALTMSFGLRNVVDLDAALRELRRVLRPGGRAIVLEFATPRPGPFAFFYERYRRHVLPAVGAAVSGDGHAYRYLDRTIATFPSGDALRARFTAAGFARTWQEALTGGSVGITVGERA